MRHRDVVQQLTHAARDCTDARVVRLLQELALALRFDDDALIDALALTLDLAERRRARPPPELAPARGPPAPLRLASWAVSCDARAECYGATVRAWLVPWGARRARLLDALGALDADLLCLQGTSAELARAACERRGAARWRATFAAARDDCGCALLWDAERLEVLSVHELALPDGLVQAVLLRHARDGAHLWVCNARLSGARALPQLLATLHASARFAAPAALVLCGELGEERGEEAWWDACVARHYGDAFAALGAERGRFTRSGGGQSANAWVDHVLTHGAARASDARLELDYGEGALPSERVPSDHLPLSVSLTCDA